VTKRILTVVSLATREKVSR